MFGVALGWIPGLGLPWWRWVYAGGWGIYLFALAWGSHKTRPKRLIPFVLAGCCLTHFVYGWHFLLGFFAPVLVEEKKVAGGRA
jgi:hypothetical protein